MAIGFARVKVIGRSAGKNACSRAAYNGNLKIKDHKINKTFYYSRFITNVHHEILLPRIVDPIFKSVEVLMNEVEKKEKRINSQLLMEYTLALPKDPEINTRHKIALTKLFVRKMQFLKNGLAVVIDVHKPNENDINWYSKVLISTRRFTIDGKELGAKARDLGAPIRRGSGKFFVNTEELPRHIKIWIEVQNNFFQFLGLGLRVDEISDIPQEHIGTKKYGVLAERARQNKQSL